jgi:hypothetical protein
MPDRTTILWCLPQVAALALVVGLLAAAGMQATAAEGGSAAERWYAPRDFSTDPRGRPAAPSRERAFERPGAPMPAPQADDPPRGNLPGPEAPSRLGPWPCPRTGAAALCQ